jgi:tetratricopeptide (TPR) repeat protein
MSSKLERKFREAVNRFQARDLAGAERWCGEVLRKAPRHPEALHLLGMVRLAGGNARDAVALISRAVEREPHNPAILENLGLAHLAAGDAAGAEAHLRRALALGAAHAMLYMRLGLALLSQRRLEEAVAALRMAAEKAPDDPDVHLNLGNALAQQGEADEALACFRRALALRPDHAHARFNIGAQLQRMGRLAEAETALRGALAAAPGDADAWHNLGAVCQQQARLDEAAACYRKALALDPRQVYARNNLGNLLRGQGRYEEAVACYQQALADDPAFLDAHVNLGIAWAEQGRLVEASAQYERALVLNPAFADAHYNLGLVRLFRHEFEQGWPGYERRLQAGEIRPTLRKDPASVGLYERVPRWERPGEAVAGEVAIWAEQGLGDQILYSTLIPELIGTEVPLVYEVDRRLLGTYERAFPGTRFVAYDEPPHAALQRASRALFAGSLPGLLRTTRESFSRQPAKLLGALPGRVAHYRSRLAALGPGPKTALSWWSARKDYVGLRKSAALEQLAPLLELAGSHFVDVQYGDTAAERRAVEDATGGRLLHFDEVDYYNDLEELLAILEACDLVITTSNATAHFAGALGKRTWLLYLADNPPFHYWAHGGSYRCLWYPSVEIVTARNLADWPSLLQHVAEKLTAVNCER